MEEKQKENLQRWTSCAGGKCDRGKQSTWSRVGVLIKLCEELCGTGGWGWATLKSQPVLCSLCESVLSFLPEAETTCATEGGGWCFMSLAFQEFPLSFLLFTRAEVQMQILGFSFRCGCGLEPQGLLCWPTVQLRRTGDPTGEKTKAQGGSSGVRILWNAEEEENARIRVFISKWDLLPRNALLKVLY